MNKNNADGHLVLLTVDMYLMYDKVSKHRGNVVAIDKAHIVKACLKEKDLTLFRFGQERVTLDSTKQAHVGAFFNVPNIKSPKKSADGGKFTNNIKKSQLKSPKSC